MLSTININPQLTSLEITEYFKRYDDPFYFSFSINEYRKNLDFGNIQYSVALNPIKNIDLKQFNHSVEEGQSEIHLEIESINGKYILVALTLINNTQAPIQLSNIAYKIVDKYDNLVFNSLLKSDIYEAKEKTYSKYRIQILNITSLKPFEKYNIFIGG
ncbi:hypothetical protein ABE021_13505 [Sporosarcina gallistercoris]|uniref:hypothetical protein n=1 Tax=Sporosarcina gallistercoris TaxID=2762245 RepID=UPI003D2E9A89